MEFVPVPFHFAATFLVCVAAVAAAWLSVTRPGFGPPRRTGRWVFAFGWVLIGLAEIAHGTQVAGTELAEVVLGLRSGGYAFIVIGLFGARRPEPAAHQATVAASGVLVPALLGIIAGAMSLRSGINGRARLGMALLLLGTSEALLGLGGAAAEIPGGGAWFVAHGARLAAAIAIGWWLSDAIRSSIQIRFVSVFVVLMLAVVVAISSAMTQVFASNVTEESLERSALEGEFQQRTIADRERGAVSAARRVAENSSVRAQTAERNSATLQATARETQSPGGLLEEFDFLGFLDDQGAILGFSAAGGDGPTIDDTEALALAGSAVVQSALGGVEASSVDSIGEDRLGIVASFPIFAPRGSEPPGSPLRQAGVVVVGNVLDLPYLATLPGVDLASDVKEVTLVKRDEVLVSTFGDGASSVLDEVAPVSFRVFDTAQVADSQGSVGGVDYFHSFVPLERRDGEVVGALVISQRSEVVELAQRDVGRLLFLIALLVAAIASVLSFVSGTRITRPLLDLTSAARKVREGDLDVRVETSSEDEVGTLGEAFDEMTVSLSKLTADLRSAADEEARLRTEIETVIQSMADGVLAVDASGVVTIVNPEAARILQKGADELVGQSLDEVLRVSDEGGDELDLPVFQMEAGNDRGVIQADGTTTHVAVLSAPIASADGSASGAVAVVRDLTAEIQVEKMKTEFLSNISHELRTPLTPIKGYTDILRRKGIPAKTAKIALDTITDSTRRLQRIVDMLVDVSAMQAGRLVPTMVEMDLDKATKELVAVRAEHHPDIKITRRGFSRMPPVMADERLLPRAIDELLDNAIKFGKRKPVKLSGEVVNKDVKIAVSDRGPGVPPEQREEIFSEFMQIDASATRAEGGLGLGLSYVQRILEAHRGKLKVASTSKGSTFTIILPGASVRAVKKKKPAKRKTKKSAKRKTAKRKTAKRKTARRKKSSRSRKRKK